jgi:hypothetical protein
LDWLSTLGYEENGYFYVNYTDRNGDTVIARFSVSPDDPNRPTRERGAAKFDRPAFSEPQRRRSGLWPR